MAPARSRALVPYALRQRIKTWPGVLWLQLTLLRPRSARQLVRSSTSLCLEGFPRSGNGYSLACLAKALGLPERAVAHHTHSIANVRRAVRRGLPTYVLVREPYDSCASLVAFGPCESPEQALLAYEDFHRDLMDLLDKAVIVPFEVLATRPELFVERVAHDLNLSAPPRDEIVAMVQRDRWPPDEVRQRKQEIQQSELSAATQALLERCEALRESVLGSAGDVLAAS